MDVRLPDGRIIKNVPEGTTKAQLMQKLGITNTVQPLEASSGFSASSIIEPAITMATGLAGTALGGLSGIVQSINPFSEQGAGANAVENAQEAMTVLPKTEEGKRSLETLGNLVQKGVDIANIPVSGLAAIGELISGQGIDKAAETINAIRGQGLSKRLGERAFEETGSPLMASLAETTPSAIESIIGTKALSAATGPLKTAAKTATKTAEQVAQSATQIGNKIFQYQTPAKQKIAEKLASGSTDSDISKYMLQGTKAVKDDIASEAIRQGFDEGVIATIKNASKADKEAMRKMIAIMQRGKKNAKEAATFRPADVAGDTLLNTYKSVKQANKDAASQLDRVAKGLKGKVDYAPAVDNFLSDLQDMGVKISDKGKIMVDFSGSDIEGLTGVETAVKRMVNRLANTGTPDAYDVHRLKKYIDENVSYGTGGDAGLKGKAETIFKRLRHNLDSTLDEAFPEYNKVNTIYAETRGAIDALQDAAGQKLNLSGQNSDKAVGTLLRRLLSNTQSRARLMDAITDLDTIANKHGGRNLLKLTGKSSGKNDLITQVLFVDELDRMFGPVARTSFQGQIEQGVKRAAKGNIKEIVIDKAAELAEKARGVNEEAAFKSIYDLLKR